MTARVYGMHAAWEMRMDRAALSACQRLPGGPASSHALLDSWMGRDTKMGYEDVLHRAFVHRGTPISLPCAHPSHHQPPLPPPAEPENAARMPKATLHDHIEAADFVITGEGYLDEQSFEGKVIGGVDAMCRKAGKPLAAVVGDSAPDVIDRIEHVSLAREYGLEKAMNEPLWCIEQAATALLRNR